MLRLPPGPVLWLCRALIRPQNPVRKVLHPYLLNRIPLFFFFFLHCSQQQHTYDNRHKGTSHIMISFPQIRTVCLLLSTAIAPSSVKSIWSKWLNLMKQMYLLTINRKHIYAYFNIVLLQFSALRWSNKQEVISHSFGFAVYTTMFKMFLLTGAFPLVCFCLIPFLSLHVKTFLF